MKIYDVVIIGAGPVGLATAIGLYSRGITNILVVDRARAFRRVGQTIDLLPNGLKSLKYIDFNTYEAVKQAGFKQPDSDNTIKKREWVLRNLQGLKISAVFLDYDDWCQTYGEGRKPIGWYDLQTTLRKQLPSDLVAPNRRCVNLIPEADCVRIDCLCNAEVAANPYAYWQEKEAESNNEDREDKTPIAKSLKAKLVVAADGINSTVRQIIYQNTPDAAFAKPEYSGLAAISSSGIQVPNYLANQLNKIYLQDNPVVSILNDKISQEDKGKDTPRLLLFGSDRTFGYLIDLPVPREEIKKKSGRDLRDFMLKKLENAEFPENLRELVAKSPEYRIVSRLYYIHRATISDRIFLPETGEFASKINGEAIEPSWSRGRVVLVGDAAHGMPPLSAQGANQGLEDAAAITSSIVSLARANNWDNTEAITAAFLKYEKLRRPTIVKVQEATLKWCFSLSEADKQKYESEIFSRNLETEITALV